MIIVRDLFYLDGEAVSIHLLYLVLVSLIKKHRAGIGFPEHLRLVHRFQNAVPVHHRTRAGRSARQRDLPCRGFGSAVHISFWCACKDMSLFEGADYLGGKGSEVLGVPFIAVRKFRGGTEKMRPENIRIFEVKNRVFVRGVEERVGTNA